MEVIKLPLLWINHGQLQNDLLVIEDTLHISVDKNKTLGV